VLDTQPKTSQARAAFTPIPVTEGIKYAGSKLKLLPHIVELISGLTISRVFDGFSGSTRVSQAFAKLGYDTTACDVAEWSEVFATCYLLNNRDRESYRELIDHLNSLPGYHGWFTEHYGGDENEAVKLPFQRKNTRRLDAIRDEIDRLKLDAIERAVALTSLILALDSVDSTLGHYASYLSSWSPRSHNDLRLKVPLLFKPSGKNEVVRGDVFDAVKGRRFDLAYFDPPYGSNNDKMPPSRVRYASYYHLWTTVIRNDKPELFGRVNRREDSRDQIAVSVFEEFRRDNEGRYLAMKAIESLIKQTDARYILLSYSSGGRATKEELSEIVHSAGKLIKMLEVDYRHNVMASMRWTNQWVTTDRKNTEYLFLVEKS
jgi:adenine-specific DNA-methyltransferase